MINEEVAQEILHELFSSFEALDTQCGAILQFLKDKGIAKEEDLAIYFEQAANASNVRWRAAGVRIEHLLSSAIKPAEQQPPTSEPRKPAESKQQSSAKTAVQEHKEVSSEREHREQSEKETQAPEKPSAAGKSETTAKSEINDKEQVKASAANQPNQENDSTSKRPEHAASQDSNEGAPRRKTA
jgi:hypothetical protein